jgi:hippurate hydrolase
VLHNGSYDFNDNLLPMGASFWVKLVEASLPLA